MGCSCTKLNVRKFTQVGQKPKVIPVKEPVLSDEQKAVIHIKWQLLKLYVASVGVLTFRYVSNQRLTLIALTTQRQSIMEENAKIRHYQLMKDIFEHLDPDGVEYKTFQTLLRGEFPQGLVARTRDDPFKLLELMTTKGKISIGKYDRLKQLVADIDSQLLDIIIKAEEDIRNIQHSTNTVPTVSTHVQETSFPVQSSSNVLDAPLQTKRSRIEAGIDDESDPLYKRLGRKGFYDNTNKKGFLLILNSVTNREGTHHDVKNLKDFFGGELNFNVYDARHYASRDFTLKELDQRLEEARNRLNDPDMSQGYYCFFCAILSHGDEKGVATSDDQLKSVDDIRKFFANDKVNRFKGKPKVFLVQACRGHDEQDAHPTEDEQDSYTSHEAMQIEDESDEIVYIPTDADVLIAYATTPGYRAHRRTKGEKLGSWFIYQALETFREMRKEEHLEEMMITVREKVALEWSTRNNVRQMPCTWSTLTKRLQLT